MKNTLLVVLPFHNGDKDKALALLRWINELEQYTHPRALHKNGHCLLLAADGGVDRQTILAMAEVARETFSNVNGISINVPPTSQGWIKGSDWMFMKVAEHVKNNLKLPFLWMEPDAVPLKPFWLDEIADTYHGQPFKYLGAIVHQTGQPDLPADHLNGNAVYPTDVFDTFAKIPEIVMGSQAWDMAGAKAVVPASKNTPLFQSFWGQADLPPVFVKERNKDSKPNEIAFSFIRGDAVYFHRDKTQSLIPILRERLQTKPEDGKVMSSEYVTQPSPAPEGTTSPVEQIVTDPPPVEQKPVENAQAPAEQQAT